MDNPRITLTQAEFDRWQLHYPSNLVCVEMPPKGDLKTKAGIVVNFNENVLYAEGEGSHVADVARVYGTIAKQVDRLYYNKKDVQHSMSWKTPLETRVSDLCWFHHLASKNCPEIEVGEKVYKLISYEDLLVAKRGKEIMPLNGFVILQEVLKEKLSWLDVSTPEVDKYKGVVRWVGTPNTEYQAVGVADLTGLKEGDVVMVSPNAYPFYLERSSWNSHFDDGKQYLCVQGRDLIAVI